ncbi:tetratricopeptide repeat protein 39B-like isoform X2 [Amphiura filiformis]
MDLQSAIEETTCALNLFLNNHFSEAKARMEPWAHASMYHALGFSTVCYLQAVMTFDPQDIQTAIQWVKNSIDVANKFRKRGGMVNSMSKMVRRPNYDNYTDDEVHSELCYAESLLERAILTFIQDDNLISFLKGGMKIRSGYQSYKSCVHMLEDRKWKDKTSKMHFESGVRFGIGCFNLMISMLPRKVLKLLEFVGFSGNRQFGLAELETGSQLPSLRSPLCSSVLIGYHSIATYVLGMADGDIQYAKDVLQPCLYNYPKGVIFLFYAGRIEEITGNMDEAIVKFEECIASQHEWKQFHHLCYWELMWCHAFKMEWAKASNYADKLCQESKWSKATYYYQQASFLAMQQNQSQQLRDKIVLMFHQVPELKQRIAGKSIPVEKFAVAKSKKHLLNGIDETLAGLELVYVWNGFSILGKKKELVEPVLLRVENTLRELKKKKEANPSYVDDYCLAMLLKGMCLKSLNRPSQAELCFQDVIDNETKIDCDNYLAPYATMELGLLYLKYKRYQEAKLFLNQAKTHKKYMLENRLHFRLHAAIQTLKSKMTGAEDVDLYDDEPDAAAAQAPSSPDDEGFSSLPVTHGNGNHSNVETKGNGPVEPAPKASQDPDGNNKVPSIGSNQDEHVETEEAINGDKSNTSMDAKEKDLAEDNTENNNVQTAT